MKYTPLRQFLFHETHEDIFGEKTRLFSSQRELALLACALAHTAFYGKPLSSVEPHISMQLQDAIDHGSKPVGAYYATYEACVLTQAERLHTCTEAMREALKNRLARVFRRHTLQPMY